MRITPRLVQIASLIIAAGGYGVACGGSTTTNDESDGGAGSDGGGTDGGIKDGAGDEPIVACGGCGCTDAGAPQTVNVTADQACNLVSSGAGMSGGTISAFAYGPACQAFCPSPDDCEMPNDYVSNVESLNPDGGALPGDGGAAMITCPTDAGTVVVTCFQMCTGRLTSGYEPPRGDSGNVGDRFAAIAFLEAVSVHAFERLERELSAHGARPDLLRDARRARRDEQRHTAMTTRIACKRGAQVRLPDAPKPAPVRPLFDVALENAVEGCVRETYGAVVGLIEAETSADLSIRRAMRSIAKDECRHAELAWAVHAWALPQLSSDQKRRIERAMRDAIQEIAERDPRTAELLFPEGADRISA